MPRGGPAGETVAILMHHGLGDAIMALPMLSAIDRRMGKGDRLILILQSVPMADLIACCDWRATPEILLLGSDRGLKGVRPAMELAADLRRRRIDRFLAPHAAAGALPAIFARIVGAKISVGPAGRYRSLGFHVGVDPRPGEHKSTLYARFAAAAGLIEDGAPLPYPPLRLGAAQKAKGARLVLAPGSGEKERHKRWPIARFAELARHMALERPDLSFVILGAPPERPLLEELAAAAGLGGRVEIAASDSFAASLALLQGSEGLVAACSGSAHLGALAGIPVLGLFGPTNPQFTGPFTPNLHIVRQDLGCAPCYRPGFETGCGTPVCMSELSVHGVAAALRDMLAGRRPAPLSRVLLTTKARSPLRRPVGDVAPAGEAP